MYCVRDVGSSVSRTSIVYVEKGCVLSSQVYCVRDVGSSVSRSPDVVFLCKNNSL